MSNIHFIAELKRTANKINITYSANHLKKFMDTIDDKLFLSFFIIQPEDSSTTQHKKAVNQHALFKILEVEPDFFNFFLNKVGKDNFIDIFFNSTFSLNYPNLLQQTLILFPEKMTTPIPYLIEKKMQSDYFILENNMNEERLFSYILNKVCLNTSSVQKVFVKLFEDHIFSQFNNKIQNVLEKQREEFISLEKPDYQYLIFTPGWKNKTYTHNNIHMDAFSFFLHKGLSKKTTRIHADILKEKIIEHTDYIQQREKSLLAEIIIHDEFNYQFTFFEFAHIFPVATLSQLNKIEHPLLHYPKFIQVKNYNNLDKFCEIFTLNKIIGNNSEQESILNTFIDPENAFELLNHGRVKNNFTLAMKNLHDYIEHIKVENINVHFQQFLDIIDEGAFKEGLDSLYFINNCTFDFFQKLKNTRILKDLCWLSDLKESDLQNIEKILLSKKEKIILDKVVSETKTSVVKPKKRL